MEIKNFVNGFSRGRAKILTAILGCLAVICIIAVMKTNDNNFIVTAQNFKGDGVTGDYTTPVSEGYKCSLYGNLYCNPEHTILMHCSSSEKKIVTLENCADNGKICQCTADYVCACVAPEAPAATGTGGATCSYSGDGTHGVKSDQCKNSGEYCFPGGVCDKGCESASKKIVRYGQTTCEKPSYLSADAVYRCGWGVDGSLAGGKLPPLRYGSGAISSVYPQGSDLYSYRLVRHNSNELCHAGCDNGACVNKNCAGKANDVVESFKRYRERVMEIGTNYVNSAAADRKSKAKEYYEKIRSFCNIPSFVAIEAFEKMAFPGGVDPIIERSNQEREFPVVTGDITEKDVLCAYNKDAGSYKQKTNYGDITVSGLNNYRCAGAESSMVDGFKGYSFECKYLDGCAMYSWVENSAVKKCPSGDSNRDAFAEAVKARGYFWKDNEGISQLGWTNIKGSDSRGCQYVSFAFLNKQDGTGEDTANNLYSEIRIPTGRCYSDEGVNITADLAGLSLSDEKITGKTSGTGEAKINYELTATAGIISHKITFSGDIRSCQFNFARKEGSACVFSYSGDVNDRRMADGALGISGVVFEKSAQGDAFVVNKSVDMNKELADTAPNKLPMTLDCEVVCQDALGNSHYGKSSIKFDSSEDAPKEGGLYDCNHSKLGPIKIGARICGVYSAGLFECKGSPFADGKDSEWLPIDCEKEKGKGWIDDCANKNPQCVPKSEVRGGEELICKDNNDCYEKFGRDYYCLYKGLGGEIGFCSKEGGCFSPSNGNKNFYKGVIVCGGNGTSQYCANPTNPPSVNGWARTPDQNCPEDKGVCNRDTGFCEGGTATQGDCKLSSLNAGGPRERKSSCSGIYVPFTLNHQGDCSGKISCEVYDNYNQKNWPANCQSSALLKTGSSNWEACVSVKSRYGDSGGGQVVKSAEIPDKINFEIECCLPDGSCVNGRSDYGNPFAKEDQEKKKEQEKSKEGGACETDKDCQEGLVCVDKKCLKKEDADKKKEEEKQNSIAPNVTISSPSGTIDTKTAQLSVTTDIAANCKYMLNQEGGLLAGNFDGAGMVLSGAGGTSHTATLSNLTNIQATSCKYNHSVTVLCKNSKASAGATSAIGSAQTNFSVDLSQKTENAPVVTAAMEPKYAIANPVLKVISDRPADCEYKKDSDFTFGGGTKFDTTGSYFHNTQLNDLKNGDHTYYVVCQDKTTCAANKPGLSVKFKVDLSEDPANAPNIVSATPETQTVANPTLSVTTDRPATCQYKKDATFTYDGGTQFPNDGEYAHSVPLADLPDGKHTFYVACKDKATGAKKTLETAIVTTLKRSGNVGAPVIFNTTPPSQNTNNPTLSVITAPPAVCQYKKDADFVYGQGLPFTVTGGTGHSVVLNNALDGPQTYYVVCQDPATQISNVPGAQIIFAVNTAAETCAPLSSNDKQNDNERSYGDEGDYNSIYLWRAAAAGTVEMFEKVDWHAGYQFTPEADGYVTELCGYFESGARNRVSLYNGSYKELAGVDISGEGGWSCVNIAPAAVKADKRYYVIARVQNDSIYFAYKSGLLPRDTENAVVESGIRQLAADGKFGESLKKYDYMVFGLVDAKIKFAKESSRGPKISELLPDGDREKGSVALSAKTDEDAACKFDREDLEYKNMKYTFGATGQKLHRQKVCDLSDGPFTWYVRCKGAADTNDSSSIINFKVDD